MFFKRKVSFIGSGNMAEAIIAGIIRAKLYPRGKIYITDKNKDRLSHVSRKYGVTIIDDNSQAVSISDIIILAVKPQVMGEVLNQASSSVTSDKLFISIAAGFSISSLEKKLSGAPVIRVMPNNPCLIGEGMSVISKGTNASAVDIRTAEGIFSSIGKTLVLDEKELDAVTALSGSGPAFVYRMVEALEEGGIKAGLSKEHAHVLAMQTALGSIRTLVETGRAPSELVKSVASPGGTTVEGLKVLDEAKFNDIIRDTVYASYLRSKEIRAEFEKL